MYRVFRRTMRYGGAFIALLSLVVFVLAASYPAVFASFAGVVTGTIIWFIYRKDT